MRAHSLALCALLVGCTGSSEPAEDDDGAVALDDSGGEEGGDDGGELDWDELNGEPPDEALPAPDFAAVNYDGAARDREDLLGHPTVMWFYPAATTGG